MECAMHTYTSKNLQELLINQYNACTSSSQGLRGLFFTNSCNAASRCLNRPLGISEGGVSPKWGQLDTLDCLFHSWEEHNGWNDHHWMTFQQTSCPRLIDISLWRQGAETAFGGQWGGQILLAKSSSTSFPSDNKECDVFVWNKEPDPLCFDEWATWDTHLHHRVKRWERKKMEREEMRGGWRRKKTSKVAQTEAWMTSSMETVQPSDQTSCLCH